MVLSASLPTAGPGALRNREDVKILGTAKESALLQAATGFYKTFAIDCSRSQVSVDMWLFASGYTDVATLGCLPRYTGGSTFFYPSFNAGRSEDALKFAHEFGEVLASPICLEAVMRVRASRGMLERPHRRARCTSHLFPSRNPVVCFPRQLLCQIDRSSRPSGRPGGSVLRY